MAGIKIQDPETLQAAYVTRYGQLVVAPLEYSTVEQVTMTLANTAYNLVAPSQGQRIVVTDIILAAGKSVDPTNNAQVDLYGADSATSTVVASSLVSLEVPRNRQLVLTGLNFLTEAGVWINVKTDDPTVTCTLGYYKVPAR